VVLGCFGSSKEYLGSAEVRPPCSGDMIRLQADRSRQVDSDPRSKINKKYTARQEEVGYN
jgi:hypothetical protein